MRPVIHVVWWSSLAACSGALDGFEAVPGLAPVVRLAPARMSAVTSKGLRGTACSATEGAAAFVDVSSGSGIQAGNFTPSPPVRIPINDHSRLALADVDADGWDDAVMHSLF